MEQTAMKNLLAATAAAGLVFAPIAAAAGTRAADTTVSLQALSVERTAAAIGKSQALGEDGDSTLLLLVAFAAVAAGVVVVVEGGENDTSPGTGG